MRGGAFKNIYVFIRPFYMQSDEEIVQDKTSIFYYGDFNLKSDCTSAVGIIEYIKNKKLEEEETALKDATFQMLISTFGTKQYTKMLNLFPSSNSRPTLNAARKKHGIYLEEVKTDSQPIVTLRTSFVSEYRETIEKYKKPIDCFIALRSLVKTNNYLQSIYDYLAGNCYVEFGLILPHTEKNFFGRYAYNFDLQDDKLDTDITSLTPDQYTRYTKYLKDEHKLQSKHGRALNYIIRKFKTDNTMKGEIETLVNYPEFFITRNRISEQIHYSDSKGGSISKNHRLLVTRSKNWKRFNVLTMGLGGDIKSFEDDIAFLERMKKAALHYIEQTKEKLSWPNDLDNIGLFFHCFPQNSIDVLHLHIVDIQSYNTTGTLVKFGYKNLHIDNVISQLKSELNTMRNNLFLQFKAASDDINELKKVKMILLNTDAICVKTVPRHNRCSIIIYKIENNWYFEIIPIKTTSAPIVYKLHQKLDLLFDDIVSHVIKSEERLKHLNKSKEYGMESIIITYGGDLWFVCYKLSHILGYPVEANDNDINMEHYFKYIMLALDLMTEQNAYVPVESVEPVEPVKPVEEGKENDDSINLYLCNDSLDNDIDDILAILFIKCMINQYKTNITLHYTEDNILKWSGTSDKDRQDVKTTIIDKIDDYMKGLTSVFTSKLDSSLLPPKSSKSS